MSQTPVKLEAAYQDTSDRVAKKLESLYQTMDPNEQRVLSSILRGGGCQPNASKAMTLVSTPSRVQADAVIDLVACVACW